MGEMPRQISFAPAGRHAGNQVGPFILLLAMIENRMVFAIRDHDGEEIVSHILSLSPLRQAIQDYHLICESYAGAAHSLPPERLEAIDMARRALHDEGARLLASRLEGKIAMDHHCARGLFTLIAILLKTR